MRAHCGSICFLLYSSKQHIKCRKPCIELLMTHLIDMIAFFFNGDEIHNIYLQISDFIIKMLS